MKFSNQAFDVAPNAWARSFGIGLHPCDCGSKLCRDGTLLVAIGVNGEFPEPAMLALSPDEAEEFVARLRQWIVAARERAPVTPLTREQAVAAGQVTP